jgi:penicillin-binding protein 2
MLSRSHGHEIDDAVLTLTKKEAARVEWPMNRAGAFWLRVFGCGVLLVLGGRVLFLNVIEGAHYREVAERNSIRSQTIPAPRGMIFDRFGKTLARNVPSVDLVAVPADMPDDREARKNILERLDSIVSLDGIDFDDALEKFSGMSVAPVFLKERLTQEETLLFSGRSNEFPGVSVLSSATRSYADGLIFSHILGYEGKIRREEWLEHPEYALTDSIGKQGIEKRYEAVLRGTSGSHRTEVDAMGAVRKELGTVASVAGSDLILNIDGDLQKKIFDVMQARLETNDLDRGAAVAIDPRNGAVLALVSYPSFDNNLFASGISPSRYRELASDADAPLFNRATSGEYPPGSTLKPVLAVAALGERVIDESTRVESSGGIRIGEAFFGDWKPDGHGSTDVRKALAESVNTFFYTVGGGFGSIRGLGMDVMKRYAKLFGLGERTGIDTTGEADGFLPDPAWKKETFGERWYTGDDYHAAIGQGSVSVTPLQMVNAIAAIANGGTLYRPHIVSQIRSTDGTTETKVPEIVREDFAEKRILRIVREGMRQTVTNGTAQSLRDMNVEVAGKTGTAEFGDGKKTQGWFESFAPYEYPEIALIVLTEGQEEHGYNAVPMTREILTWYFDKSSR